LVAVFVFVEDVVEGTAEDPEVACGELAESVEVVVVVAGVVDVTGATGTTGGATNLSLLKIVKPAIGILETSFSFTTACGVVVGLFGCTGLVGCVVGVFLFVPNGLNCEKKFVPVVLFSTGVAGGLLK